MRIMRAGVEEIADLQVLGDPNTCILSFQSANKDINIFAVADVMQDQFGWKVERQHRPDSIHLSVMPPHAKVRAVQCAVCLLADTTH
jgi:sphinganine-1-phosphate aldolase